MTDLGRWSLAFTASIVVVLVAGGFLRSFARRARSRSNLVRAEPQTLSHDAAARLHESQRRGLDLPRRRLGGVVLLLGVLAGLVFGPSLPGRWAVVLLVAVALVVIGGLYEFGIVTLPAVVFAPVAAGAVVYVADIRADPTDIASLDAAATILWVALLATAFRGFGDTPGISVGLGAAASAGVFALAGFAEQGLIATLAAALGGACLGFLAYNLRPASLFPGKSGGALIGFLLAVATIEVEVPIESPGNVAVPLILLALPLVDVIVVLFGRIHHGVPLARHRGDHLTHRLEARGASIDVATAIMMTLQIVMSAIAVFVGRGVVPVPVGLAGAALLVLLLLAVTLRQLVYTDATPVRVLLWVGVGVVVLLFLASIPAALAGLQARQMLDDGRKDAEAAVEAARDGEPDLAAERFAAAADKFDDARSRLHSPLVSPGLLVPVLAPNLEAARELSDAGVDLAEAGVRLTSPVDPEKLRVRGGQLSLEEVRKVQPSLTEAATLLSDTRERVDSIETDFLLPPVRDALDEVGRELARTEGDAKRGAEAALRLPAILGGDGPRRYFLAVQNNAEARAGGGIILFWGILTADNGKVDLDDLVPVRRLNEGIEDKEERGEPVALDAPDDYLRRYGRYDPAHTWQNVNLSPDFPSTGQAITSLFPQATGFPIDGIVRVDPYGLAALLELTGPVRVDGWPERVSAENVVDITLRDEYEVFRDDEERDEFLGDMTRTIIDEASSGDLGAPGEIAEVLGEATRGGHLALHFTRPEEQQLARVLDADGRLAPPRSDAILVTTNNAGANKLDYYLNRRLNYEVELEPAADGRSVAVSGNLKLTLENTVEPEGKSPIVVGPNIADLQAGDNYSIVSVYSPLEFTGAAGNGFPVELAPEKELGRNVASRFFNIPAKSTLELDYALEGVVPMDADHWYRIDLGRQPTVQPDHVKIRIDVPSGWRIAETRGLRRAEADSATGEFELVEPETVAVRLERSSSRNLWDRLRDGP
jgi:UDP-N-acetylmuramyl pentapeptide phosphotransferase/UDP-N-acetylglucosamine-1-phosphate transferase